MHMYPSLGASAASVRRACLPLSDWPSWPAIDFSHVYVSRYVNTAYTIHDAAALYRRLDAVRKGPGGGGGGIVN